MKVGSVSRVGRVTPIKQFLFFRPYYDEWLNSRGVPFVPWCIHAFLYFYHFCVQKTCFRVCSTFTCKSWSAFPSANNRYVLLKEGLSNRQQNRIEAVFAGFFVVNVDTLSLYGFYKLEPQHWQRFVYLN